MKKKGTISNIAFKTMGFISKSALKPRDKQMSAAIKELTEVLVSVSDSSGEHLQKMHQVAKAHNAFFTEAEEFTPVKTAKAIDSLKDVLEGATGEEEAN